MTTLVLLLFGVPMAWWLATTRSRLKPVAEALTALPLVLPPTVLGFYLLILLSPTSTFGGFWVEVTGTTLTFSFIGPGHRIGVLFTTFHGAAAANRL